MRVELVIKAVFFDIDGTLLTDRKTIRKSTENAILKLKKRGILVGLATGRGPSFTGPFLENLGLDFAVCYNGQYIFTRDKVLYQNRLSKKHLLKFIHYAGAKNREISLGTASGLIGSRLIHVGTSRLGQIMSALIPKKFSRTIQKSFKHVIRRLKPQNYGSLTLIAKEPVYQIILVATEEETKVLTNRFPELKLTRSSPYSMDIISKDQSKTRGIQRLGELFKFTLDEVMAFGDSENDIEMLSDVGIGIAMGNSDTKVKQQAHYVTATNNNDGIAKALAHYGLIHFGPKVSFESQDENFNKVRSFHQKMDGKVNYTPKLFQDQEASHRANFKIEELVEFLYATSARNQETFDQSILSLHEAIDKAVEKVQSKEHPETPLVGQIDALIDLLYFTYGTFVLSGVDPAPFFEIVHEANMGKIFPDGKAHFDPVTHKILKPDDWEERFAPELAIKRELNRQLQKALQRQNSR